MSPTPVYRRAEIVIVLLVLAALAAYSIPSFLRARRVARERACHANLEAIEKAADIHQLARGEPPPDSLDAVYGPGKAVEGPPPVCPLRGHYALKDGRAVCDHK